VTWSEPEAFSSVISRKEHPRDPTSILSIREVLRQKSPVDGAGLTTSRFGSLGSAASKNVAPTPPSAWAKPDVQVSMDAADGEVSTTQDTVESAGKILQEIESVTESSRPSSRAGSITLGPVDTHIRRGKASSIISIGSSSTVGRGQVSTVKLNLPPPPPPKDTGPERKAEDVSDAQSVAQTTTSSFAGTLASGLNSAMRFMLSGGDTPRPTSPYGRNHHGLLSADASSIDERPHIKYDWTIGKRLKFSCTVYYAKQFDILRRRCGIDDVFLKSLSRSANWAADGGKSKSNFWKTSDDRFIIKTLVDAWNVADL
jgi:1-phosphatidylinositol-3-phosphate 5-kinase